MQVAGCPKSRSLAIPLGYRMHKAWHRLKAQNPIPPPRPDLAPSRLTSLINPISPLPSPQAAPGLPFLTTDKYTSSAF